MTNKELAERIKLACSHRVKQAFIDPPPKMLLMEADELLRQIGRKLSPRHMLEIKDALRSLLSEIKSPSEQMAMTKGFDVPWTTWSNAKELEEVATRLTAKILSNLRADVPHQVPMEYIRTLWQMNPKYVLSYPLSIAGTLGVGGALVGATAEALRKKDEHHYLSAAKKPGLLGAGIGLPLGALALWREGATKLPPALAETLVKKLFKV